MKNWLIGFLIVIVVILIGVRIYANTHPVTAPSPSQTASPIPIVSSAVSSPSSNTTTFCSPTKLQPQIETEPAAGNIWGTVTITNNGNAPCQILGNNPLQASFDPLVKNITVTSQDKPTADSFTLEPKQSIYSQIHYPNGPQCSGAPKQQNVIFNYTISPTNSITFLALDGKNTFSIPTCTDPKEITDIQTWSLSDKPITQ